MNDLSDAFHELVRRDERAFAQAPRDAGALAHARRARHRTRAAQATGGTLAVGALAVGGVQLLPGGGAGLNAATSPSAATSPTVLPSDEASEAPTEPASQNVAFHTGTWSESGNVALSLIDDQIQCGAAAPTPTAGRATISLDGVTVRPDDYVRDLQPWIDGTETGPLPVVDDEGFTMHGLVADASIVATDGETLFADVPATVVALAKDGEVVGLMGADAIDPTELQRMIEAPEGTPESANQEQWVTEFGVTPVLSDDPVSFTTGYVGWDCPTGVGAVEGDQVQHIYPPLGDYLEPGDYEAYVLARVIVDEQAAAEHALRESGFDLWNGWTYGDQLTERGLDGTEAEGGMRIDVPVPAERLPAEASDEIIVSEPVTVTIP